MEYPYINDIRFFAKMGMLQFKMHAIDSMYVQSVTREDIENVLSSSSNEVLEIQEQNKVSSNEIVVIYDRSYAKDLRIVIELCISSAPMLRIITVQMVDDKEVHSELSLVIK